MKLMNLWIYCETYIASIIFQVIFHSIHEIHAVATKGIAYYVTKYKLAYKRYNDFVFFLDKRHNHKVQGYIALYNTTRLYYIDIDIICHDLFRYVN